MDDVLPGRGRLLIRGASVLTMDPQLGRRPGWDILVDDGEILAIGPAIDDPEAEVIARVVERRDLAPTVAAKVATDRISVRQRAGAGGLGRS